MLKKRLQSGETVLGAFVIVDSPIMLEAAGLAGLDFAILDMEHGPFDLRDVERLIPVAANAGVAPIVRVGQNDEWMILRALDVGASGVQVPQVNCRANAQAVVHSAKYAPLGERGVSTFTRAGRLNTRGPGYFQEANAETLVVVHIEGVEGVRNLDDILGVEGIDVAFIGPYDLSQSLGIPGQTDDPRVQDAVRECVRKTRAAGKVAGSFAKDLATARRWIDIGIQYVAISVDAGIYREACAGIVRNLKGS
jgi:2-keto-3-deoxy-L-rhamnonate aldolase RhmA